MKVSVRAAEAFFHGFSGWLIFMVSFAFLVVLSGLLRILRSRLTNQLTGKAEKKSSSNSFLGLSKIKHSYLWTASLLLVFSWGLNTTFAAAQASPSRKTFDEFPTAIGEWKGRRSYVRPEILKELWADDYVQIEFRHSKTGDLLLLFVPYYEYQGTRHTAHSPVSCLVGGGFAPRSRKIVEKNFPEPFGKVRVRQMVLEKNKLSLLSNYWFQQRGRIVVSEYSNKWYLFWDSLTKRRTDGALIRLEMVLRGNQDIKSAQSIMDAFTLELMKILPQYVPV
jgi:EpsI family protein